MGGPTNLLTARLLTSGPLATMVEQGPFELELLRCDQLLKFGGDLLENTRPVAGQSGAACFVAVLALGSLVGLLLGAAHTMPQRQNGRHVKH